MQSDPIPATDPTITSCPYAGDKIAGYRSFNCLPRWRIKILIALAGAFILLGRLSARAHPIDNLLKAIREDSPEKVQHIIKSDPTLLTARSYQGHSALYEAVYLNRREIVDLLISLGAPVNIQTERGTTPLHAAAYYDNQELVVLLLSNKADPNLQDLSGNSPLHTAAARNSVRTTQTLLEFNADPNLQNNQGRTPLHLAAQHGHLTMSRLLIEHGAQINVLDKTGCTPFNLCLQHKKGKWQQTAELLRQYLSPQEHQPPANVSHSPHNK